MLPFQLVDGPLTRSDWVALKAIALANDPDNPDAEKDIREAVERRGEREIARELRKQFDKTIPVDMTVAEANGAIERLRKEGETLRDTLRRMLQESADLGTFSFLDASERIGLSFDYTLANEAAARWARQYSSEVTDQIMVGTERRVAEAIGDYVRNGDPISSLRRELTPTFGRRRARTIAVTEVTRAFAQANEIAYALEGVEWKGWRTSRDEKVCPICGKQGADNGLDGEIAKVGESFIHPGSGNAYRGPPAHPNCRCWTVAVIPTDEEREKLSGGSIEKPNTDQDKNRDDVDFGGPFTPLDYRTTSGAAAREKVVAAELEFASKESAFSIEHSKLSKEYRSWRLKIQNEYGGSRFAMPRADQDAVRKVSDRLTEIVNELDGLQKKRDRAIKRALSVPVKDRNKFNTRAARIGPGTGDDKFKGSRWMDKETAKNTTEATKFLESINGVKTTIRNNVPILENTGGRAFASPRGNFISIEVGAEQTTIVHELGHVLEYQRVELDPRYQRARQSFFRNRTIDDKLEKMNEAFPDWGYRDDEVFRRDKWKDPYMGKVYGRPSSSELISMGIQELYADAAAFAQSDPEYFDFIVSYVRGDLFDD